MADATDTQTRYNVPLKYTNAFGDTQRVKLFFELSGIDLMDWTVENPQAANLLRTDMEQMRDVFEEGERDLTRDETLVLMRLVKVLADLSAGKPTDDGEYFIKDPNWTYSYAYREFRTMLFTNPKAMNDFMDSIINDKMLSQFVSTLEESNKKNESTVVDMNSGSSLTEDEIAKRAIEDYKRQQEQDKDS